MDNELKIFLQSFKELENLFQALPITETQIQQLKGFLSGIQKNAKNLALYDSITHALNARAMKWLGRELSYNFCITLQRDKYGRSFRAISRALLSF